MPFFPTTPAEKWSTYSTIAAIFLFWLIWRPRFYPVRLSLFNSNNDYHLKLVEWERDRVINLAKGVAGTSITYLLALVPVLFKKDFTVHTPPFVILGILAGFLGALILACDMSFATSQFTRSPTVSPRVQRHQRRSLSLNKRPPRRPIWPRAGRFNDGGPDDEPPPWPGRRAGRFNDGGPDDEPPPSLDQYIELFNDNRPDDEPPEWLTEQFDENEP